MQYAIANAALPFGCAGGFDHLINGIGLSAEREGELFFIAAPPHFHSDSIARLVVSQPAFRRARQWLPIEGQLKISLLQARHLGRASGLKAADPS